MNTYGAKFSLLIFGQILSRIPESQYDELINWLKKSKDNFYEIVISTRKNEVNYEIEQLIDRLVIVDDPGPDNINGKNQSNHTRQLSQIISGIAACNSKYVFKTRVEFYKMSLEIIGAPNSKYLFDTLEQSKIDLIIPAPGTLSAQKNGCPLFLSDTMVIAQKENFLKWYITMANDYSIYKGFWYKERRFIENLAFEQIFGLALIQDFVGYKIKPKEAKRLNKIYVSKVRYKTIQKHLPERILLFNPNILEIQQGRFLSIREDYMSKPMFIDFEVISYYLFKCYGVKYTVRKFLSKYFRRVIPYNGRNSLRSIMLFRSLR